MTITYDPKTTKVANSAKIVHETLPRNNVCKNRGRGKSTTHQQPATITTERRVPGRVAIAFLAPFH